MRETGIPPVLIWDVVAGGAALSRGLGELIRHFVARGLAVRGDPADGDLAVSAEDSGADLHRRNGEALVGARGV